MKPQDIRALRTAYGLTREEFARALGVNKQTLYFWETGKSSPSRYDILVLHKLWSMLHNSDQREIAQNALNEAKDLTPAPSEENNIGDFIAGGLIGFGLGLLLSSLFRDDKKGKKNV